MNIQQFLDADRPLMLVCAGDAPASLYDVVSGKALGQADRRELVPLAKWEIVTDDDVRYMINTPDTLVQSEVEKWRGALLNRLNPTHAPSTQTPPVNALNTLLETHAGVRIYANGAEVASGVSFADLAAALTQANLKRRAHQWAVADMLLYAERFGEVASQLQDERVMSYQTAANIKSTAAYYPRAARVFDLTFTHYTTARGAGIDFETSMDLLQQAQDEGWSVEALRKARQAAQNAGAPRNEATSGTPTASGAKSENEQYEGEAGVSPERGLRSGDTVLYNGQPAQVDYVVGYDQPTVRILPSGGGVVTVDESELEPVPANKPNPLIEVLQSISAREFADALRTLRGEQFARELAMLLLGEGEHV